MPPLPTSPLGPPGKPENASKESCSESPFTPVSKAPTDSAESIDGLASFLDRNSAPESYRETLDALLRENPPSADSNTVPSNGEPTDRDLANALAPLLKQSLPDLEREPPEHLPALLEPMIRNTVRRAIAEQLVTAQQFRRVGFFDRIVWRIWALLSSRSYQDIVFERTHRFQVEEAYLIRRSSRTLISYAHHDPGIHISPRRIRSRLRRLITDMEIAVATTSTTFDIAKPDSRLGVVREGEHCYLIAVLRGSCNALVRADLDYHLTQIEARLGLQLEQESDTLLRVVQPLLEGCLLIQAPAPLH